MVVSEETVAITGRLFAATVEPNPYWLAAVRPWSSQGWGLGTHGAQRPPPLVLQRERQARV